MSEYEEKERKRENLKLNYSLVVKVALHVVPICFGRRRSLFLAVRISTNEKGGGFSNFLLATGLKSSL